jgi:hypothetical protein
MWDFDPNRLPQAAVAPMAAAISRKDRRVMVDIGGFPWFFARGRKLDTHR